MQFIRDIAARAGVEIILALKAFANWRVFPIIAEYIDHTTASSPYEARLSAEHFGGLTHTYSPAYEEHTFGDILRYSSHITFNSFSQLNRFLPMVRAFEQSADGHPISVGLRINPEYSEIETELYNPCAPGSRFGCPQGTFYAPSGGGFQLDLDKKQSLGLGLHFHCLCENDATALENVLESVEEKFGALLDKVEWLNMGGGHLMTREGYNVDVLLRCTERLHKLHPNLRLIMEPGSAFLWQTGYLTSRVVDIVENAGIKTAILNVSFTCHMPDCLEMPYWPTVRGAETLHPSEVSTALSPAAESACRHEIPVTGATIYRLGGCSCLSGDYMGYWRFRKPLEVGDEIIFEDMIHYTTVKTNMFNGVHHPSIALKRLDGTLQLLRQFTYADYEARMD